MTKSTRLTCLSGFCTGVLVAVNSLSILIGGIFLAAGIVLTVGIGWVVNNGNMRNLLSRLSEMLENLIHSEVDMVELANNLNSITGSVGVTFIVIGAILLIISFLGCFGSCCKIRPCLIIYVGIVGAFFLAQLTIVIIWYADSNILKSRAKIAMEGNVRRYTGLRSGNVESLLQNLFQIYFGCCGVNNGSDYETLNTHWDREYTMTYARKNFTFNLTYPVTCCKFKLTYLKPIDPFCPYNGTTNSNHEVGCFAALFSLIERYFLHYLFAALAGVLALQILLAFGALIVYRGEVSKKPSRVKPSES